MDDSQLTALILDERLLKYTTSAAQDALKPRVPLQKQRRAVSALEFFTSLLDSNIERERQQLDIFNNYLKGLKAIASSPTQVPPPLEHSTDPLGPIQNVLNLPEMLDEILSHISPLSKEGRSTFRSTALISRSFHNASNLTLWKTPRDLDTVERQIQFAFSAAISGSMGKEVDHLRIRRIPGGWNDRIILKIAHLCPDLEALVLHCGDSEDGTDPITQDSVNSLHDILSILPNLKDLSLLKFSYTPEVESLELPEESSLPFTNLHTLRLYDFGWYWPAIIKGLGRNLQTLDVGLLPSLTSAQLIQVAKQTPGLKSLCISCFIDLEPIRQFALNSALERLHIMQFSEHDAIFGSELLPIIIEHLPNLLEFTLSNVPMGYNDVSMITASKLPLQEVDIQLGDGLGHETEECNRVLTELIKSKRETLRHIDISFEGSFELKPTDSFIEALGLCSKLEYIIIPFASPTGLTAQVVDSLLKGCPRLALTWSLEILVEGNSLYEKEYKAVFERSKQDEEDIVLGN
ncbi:hypothetical protein C8J56DRAFT_773533 [Mycena floridula]|nr:hypothetical protein C8J56DRAFT_773533 [Mycena floridula]